MSIGITEDSLIISESYLLYRTSTYYIGLLLIISESYLLNRRVVCYKWLFDSFSPPYYIADWMPQTGIDHAYYCRPLESVVESRC